MIINVEQEDERWKDVAICGGIEAFCMIVLFGVTWMIANMEDLNALLINDGDLKTDMESSENMILYHYYEQEIGPFRSISDLPDDEAERVLQRIRTEKPDIFLAKRPEDYLQKRRHFEGIHRNV